MPIYAYKCGSCGHAKDVLQKISDAPLTVCPACGADAFTKQVTAAGFQLKGSGWYATDFKGGATPAAPATSSATDAKPAEATKSGDTAGKPADNASSSPKSDTPSASAGGCGASCACH
jgi:putative FmdB family regulatory protein